ncbi:hypothetical protein OOK31_18850 [Streptomyces sp. NBC_00249]|uniref:hypothetical protein n=1 Tax=Streptomyces sp. NBC_00249 TaxID=2975690 RepID=UPI00225C39E0|nr:hypothetical protein [Streptomyces sp. NBC_00249]MCX5195926.1 hypothetical protein [Streptomyces sp. NBC_00249]
MATHDFGYTKWGKDWVRFAETLRQTRPDPQLPSARRMARDGKVQITIDGRTVRAVVHRGRGATVTTVEVAPMSPGATAEISRQLSGVQPVLTDDLYVTIADAGHPPAPKLLAVTCSCPAGTPRCIHELAVYYDMARRIDDDPRIALDVQGFFRGPADSKGVSTAGTQQRWIALNALDPAAYFTASE